jgi:hypothetical protein
MLIEIYREKMKIFFDFTIDKENILFYLYSSLAINEILFYR